MQVFWFLFNSKVWIQKLVFKPVWQALDVFRLVVDVSWYLSRPQLC